MTRQKRNQPNVSNPLLDPVIRKEFLDHMTQMCVQWNDEVLEGWFEQPYDNMALQLLIEAQATALAVMAARNPDKPAIVEMHISAHRGRRFRLNVDAISA